jgi:tRNA modification GTPase
MRSVNDIIAAISTPPGKGGVALIRVSGKGAFDIADRIFKPRFGRPLCDCPPRYQIYGDIFEGDEALDDVLLTKFTAGASYTGEECVEISCHGGMLLSRTLLELIFRHGAREAMAGEFTRRAFINGRLSLSEAEAVGNLLEAKTREQIRLSGTASRDRLTERVEGIRGMLVSLMSSMMARIDYPDEDLGDFSESEMLGILNNVKCELKALVESYRTGRAINEGICAVICGKPNVGKSSLYNLLLGEDSAIVTDIRGTTRDVLTSSLSLGRVMLNISDTAGIRDGGEIDLVERLGIERSREAVEHAELIITVFDASGELDGDDLEIIEFVKGASGAKLALINKTDLGTVLCKKDLPDIFDSVISVSANETDTRGKIAREVERLFTDERIVVGEDAVVYTARQSAELKRCLEFVELSIEALALGFGQDAVASDVERAISAISELDGREVSDAVVSDIFKKFCVGK